LGEGRKRISSKKSGRCSSINSSTRMLFSTWCARTLSCETGISSSRHRGEKTLGRLLDRHKFRILGGAQREVSTEESERRLSAGHTASAEYARTTTA